MHISGLAVCYAVNPGEFKEVSDDINDRGIPVIDLDDLAAPESLRPQPVPQAKDSVIPHHLYTAPQNSNPHAYPYLINSPSSCRENLFLLVLIRTKPSHTASRAAIRATWGAQRRANFTQQLVFLVGTEPNISIVSESLLYGDIVQEDFVESYANLTLKTAMAYKWTQLFCRTAKFVLIADDDIVVDIYKLTAYLHSIEDNPSPGFVLCYLYHCCRPALWQGLPHDVGPHGRLYRGIYYPQYCAGAAMAAPLAAINKLYLMSLDTPQFAPDDAWVGVLAEKLGLTFVDTFKSYSGLHSNTESVIGSFNHSQYLSSPVMVGVLNGTRPQGTLSANMHRLWGTIQRQHRMQPKLNVAVYMQIQNADFHSDTHIYRIAVAALVFDLAVMLIIGYLIFCRKKQRCKLPK